MTALVLLLVAYAASWVIAFTGVGRARGAKGLRVILSWQCQQCGWINDNNPGPCHRCGGDEDAKGKVTVKRDEARIKAFDARKGKADD